MSAKKHFKNLTINWFSFIANIAVMFFLSPFILFHLGKENFGIWSLLNVLTGYLGLMDVGVRSSIGRHIALYIGKNDDESVDETIRTASSFFIIIGFNITIASLILGYYFPIIFKSLPPHYNSVVIWLLPLLAIDLLSSAFSAMMGSLLAAHDRFDLARLTDISILILRATATILILRLNNGLVSLAILTVSCNFLAVPLNYYFSKKIYPKFKMFPFCFSRFRINELLSFGIFAFISKIAYKLSGQSDLLIVEWISDFSQVAVYSVGAMGIYYSGTLFIQIERTFFPSIQRSIAAKKKDDAFHYFRRQGTISLLLGIMIYIGILFFAYDFIFLWMGSELDKASVKIASNLMVILAISKFCRLLNAGAEQILTACGEIRSLTLLEISQAIINIILSFIFALCFKLSLYGVALGTLSANLLIGYPIMRILLKRRVGLKYKRLFIEREMPVLFSGCFFAYWCFVVRSVWCPLDWGMFIFAILLCVLGYIPIAFLFVLDRSDKRKMISWFKRLLTI